MRRFVAMLLCLALGGTAAAGTWDELATPSFGHLGRENGLPHDIVTDLVQDRSGFIWAGTQGGLARWDGYRFRVFTHLDGDAGSLPDSTIVRLLVDRSGRLWVAMNSGRIARYDASGDRFETLPTPDIGVPGGLAEDGEGGLWIGGSDGLAHFTEGSWHREIQITGDVGPTIRCLMRAQDGTLWACGPNKLFHQATQGGGFAAVESTPGADPIRAVLEEPGGRIWYGTEHAGIGLLDPATGTRQELAAPDPTAGQVRELAISGPDEIWAVAPNTGIFRVHATKGVLAHMRSRDGFRATLGADTLYAVLRDRSGLLWVGGLGGIWFRPSGDALVDTIWPVLDPVRGPLGLDTLAVCADRSDHVWLATLRAGLLAVDRAADGHATIRKADPTGGADAAALTCAVGPDGTVYAGQRKGITIVAPGAPGRPLDAPELDTAGPIKAILPTAAALWIGSENGVYRADPDGQIRQHLTHRADDPGSLTNNSAETMVQDASGALWIGTHSGLNRLDPASGAIERILPGEAADSLPGPNEIGRAHV